MKNLLLILFMLFGLTVSAQQQSIARSVQINEQNQSIITIGVPLIKVIKLNPEVDTFDVFELTSETTFPPTNTWLDMIKCIKSSQGFTCEDLDCADSTSIDKIEAGVWKVVASGGIWKGFHMYWVQGQAEPLLNHHNGIIRFNGREIQIYQMIGNDKPLSIGQELRFYAE